MNEQGPDFKRVTIDIPTANLPELMQHIGVFAVSRGIAFEFESIDSDAVKPSIHVEKQKYNHDLVSWVTDPESQTYIAIVTSKDLVNYTVANNRERVGSRIFNS